MITTMQLHVIEKDFRRVYLAIRVFPVPGGPKRSIPFTCFIPV